MPWTFAHPAAVIPIAKMTKGRLPFIALAIGSCSPDFGYYVNLWEYASRSHQFVGSLITGLPICLLMIFALALFREGVLQLFPSQMAKLLPGKSNFTIQSIFYLILAIIIGIYSHIIWDSFTHNPKYFRDWWPFIRHNVTIGQFSTPLYKILQHTSSVVGVTILLFYARKAVNKPHAMKQNSMNWQVKFWCILLSSSCLFSIINYHLNYEIKFSEIHHFLFINAVNGGIMVFIGLCLAIVTLQIYHWLKSSKSNSAYGKKD